MRIWVGPVAAESVPLPHKRPKNFDFFFSYLLKTKWESGCHSSPSPETHYAGLEFTLSGLWSLKEISFCKSSNLPSWGVLWAEYRTEILCINKIQTSCYEIRNWICMVKIHCMYRKANNDLAGSTSQHPIFQLLNLRTQHSKRRL